MASTTNNKKITLYLNVVCPYAQRAWQTAVEKGLDFEAISVPLRGDKPDWCVFFVRLGALKHAPTHLPPMAMRRYWKVNPRGTVPTLVHGERTIHESVPSGHAQKE
jgi:glutathione S-transferase